MVRVSVKDGGAVSKPDDPAGRNGRSGKPRRAVTVTKTPRHTSAKAGSGDGDTVTFPTASAVVAKLERRHGKRSAEWTYQNAVGEPVGTVVRWDLPPDPADPERKPRKLIQPVSKFSGGWANRGMPTPRPLYRLPDLIAAPAGVRVWIVEGEKTAEAAWAVGLLATTSPHGSESAAKADWSALAGCDVVIVPDHDHAGNEYAATVMRLALAAGARSVRIVRLVELWAGMPEKGDLVDYLAHKGGDADAVRSDVEGLANWAEPETIDPEPEAIIEYEPFPVDALPEPIRSLVVEGAKAIACDASYLALPLLSELAAAVGNTRAIGIKNGWTEPAIVWTAIVGESGTAKSPAMELAMRPVRKRQHESMKQHKAEMEEHREALARHQRDAAHWQRGKSDDPPPTKPEAPTAVRYWTDDVTTEALAVLLQQNPRGLLLVKDELSGWFNFDRYAGGKGGGDAAKWLEMFGGRPMIVDRKGGGTIYVPRAAVPIAGGIQPETLRRVLGIENTENGLASRILMASPPKVCPGWSDDGVSATTQQAVAGVFDWLYALTPMVDEYGDELPRLVTLDPEARAAMVDWVNWHARQMQDLSGPIGFAWAKLKGYAARLALVVHLTRCAVGDSTTRDPAFVDAASIAAGVQLARWFGDEARRIYAMMGESDEDQETRGLVEWIRARGGSVTVRDVTHGKRRYKRDAKGAEAALSRLVVRGSGAWEWPPPGPKGGAPTKLFRLVSAVTVTTTPADGPANGGIGDGDAGDAAASAGDGWRVL